MAPPMAETQEYWITVQFREVLINYVILTMSKDFSSDSQLQHEKLILS